MASVDQKKADENVLRLVEEQKKKKQEALNKMLPLERLLDAKQKLEMEYEELKGKLQVKKHLGDEIDLKNENLDELQYKYTEKTMTLSRMFEEKDMLHHAFCEEIRKMQRLAQEHLRRILDEQETLSQYLDRKKRELDTWSKQLNRLEALTERERQKLEEDMQKSSTRNNSLQMASVEQKKADENVLRLVEEQKKEKQEPLNKILQLERQLDAKQKLEMEIEELKGEVAGHETPGR